MHILGKQQTSCCNILMRIDVDVTVSPENCVGVKLYMYNVTN